MRVRHARNPLVAATLTALTALLVGCGSDSDGAVTAESAAPTDTSASAPATPPTTSPSSPPATPVAPPPPSVPEILQFTAATLDGGTFDGASLAGTNAVFWFWAPWCPICKAAGGDVAALSQTLGDAARVVGVGGLSGSAGDMRSFVDDSGTAALTHIADTDGAAYTRFGVTQQHTYVLVSASGEVRTVEAYGEDPDLVALAREHFRL